MKTKKGKTFDCVEMKRRIQTDLMAEYESRKDQFSSFADFIHKTAASDLKIRAFQEKVSKAAQQGGTKRKASNMK
ncbi:MAG: hypothetical protein JSW39_23640 [Desulfobacterales bacterium]|nr:MAG: hypothetical protein JSW39_23640 [Desulfobacterales bacterium]